MWLGFRCFITECPTNCLECTYDTTVSKTTCNDNRCKDGYDVTADSSKTCGGMKSFK